MIELTQKLVRELLHYDKASGHLTWKRRSRKWFKRDSDWKDWNRQNAGQRAFKTPKDARGYLVGEILGHKNFYAHRIIFLWMTGTMPSQVDHDNHDKSDNRWSNFNSANHRINGRNQKLRSTNKSGHNGVFWHKQTKKWQAVIATDDGEGQDLGRYDTIEEAIAVRKKAEREYNYNPNHGRR